MASAHGDRMRSGRRRVRDAGGAKHPLRFCVHLRYGLKQVREAHAEASCDLRHSLDRRIPQARFDPCDIGAIEIGPLGEHFLRPLLGFAELTNPRVCGFHRNPRNPNMW